MADIVINEISQNYSYVIGDSSYCCVALPITSCWGPAYTASNEDEIEDVVWQRFRANSQGLESFVSTYRGAAANYRLSQDYSYQMAVSLLTAGYDVLVCRLSPGNEAQGFLRKSYRGQLETAWGSDLDATTNATGNYGRPIKGGSYSHLGSGVPVASIISCTYTEPGADAVTLTEGIDYKVNYITGELTFLESSTIIPEGPGVENSYATLTYTFYSSNSRNVISTGEATLPMLDAAGEPIASIPLYCDANHPITVSSSHPNFTTATITETVDSIPADAPSGIYAKGSSGAITSIVYYLKGTLAQRADTDVWAANGIVGGETYTVTGDKVLKDTDSQGTLTLRAKYPGTFGNRLQCSLRRMTTAGTKYWNLITYIVDTSGVRTAVENLNFVFDIENSTDAIPYVEEIESQFVDIEADHLNEESIFAESIDDKLTIVFTLGSDKGDFTDAKTSLKSALDLASKRYGVTPVAYTPEGSFEAESDVKQGNVYTISPAVGYLASVTSCKYGSGDTWTDLVENTDYAVDTEAGTVTLLTVTTNPIIPVDPVAGKQLQIEYTCTPSYKSSTPYIQALCDKYNKYLSVDDTTASTYEYLEWVFTNCIDLYGLLEDKLAYNPNRVISPGWDDQNFLRLSGDSSYNINITTPSPLHLTLMKTAYSARCATAYIDLPKSLAKQYVSKDLQQPSIRGYAQLLARQDYADTDGLFTTHSALFGPWGTYMYVGTSKQSTASPSFLALLIQRSMILNQSLQYEWIQPSSRKNNVNIGKMDYTVSKKYLEAWQPDPDTEGGVGVNAIANIPDLGLSVWGDSTLYENPPATYQALRNLSTRLLVNAIKNVVYKVGISITFQYTNQTAFSSFYVGVTPILDIMKNSGAIGDYKVIIGNDFDALGMVKANSCVGKILITPNGTIQHITVDLIALPPQTDLSSYN